MKKVVLAYSGGLDTSCAVKWLKDRDYFVICYMADVGQGGNFNEIKKRAFAAGADKVVIESLQKEFVEDFAFVSLKAGAVYESKYFLATALSRPLIGKGLVNVARKEKAQAVSHGCTGKGNDQVRIETSVMSLGGDLEIIAPVRVWEFKTRNEEIDYAKKQNIPIDVTKKSPYSLDKNLWGVSIECGILEDPMVEPPKDAYQWTNDPKDAPNKETYIEVTFEKGIPIKVNGKSLEPVQLVEKLNEIGGLNGVGRCDLVENRLVGIKSREIYEAPAAYILHTAYEALENLVLDRETFHFKKSLSLKYAEMVYFGLWFTPLKSALDKFFDEVAKKISGTTRLKLYKGTCAIVGRTSPNSLYKKDLATYDEGDKFDQSFAEGFIRIWGLPYKK